jgi:hypothetical protein
MKRSMKRYNGHEDNGNIKMDVSPFVSGEPTDAQVFSFPEENIKQKNISVALK